jgi:LPXTG-motif cell wall-anchored protein
MVGFGRTQFLPAALVALILASVSRAQSDTLNFNFYPEGARTCLDQAAASSQCEASTVELTNACLCRNGGDFITTAAACIGRESPGDLEEVYKTMSDACNESQTRINVSKAEFMAAASGATTTTSSRRTTTTRTSSKTSATSETIETATESATTTTTGTNTATATSTSSADDDQQGGGSSGLSTGAMAGVIAGAIGGCAVLAGVAFFLFRRRRKVGEESHPMLPQQAHHLSMAPSGHSSTAYYGSPPDTGGWPKKDWGTSPDLRNSGFNWESPAHLSSHLSTSYPGGGAGGPIAPSPPLPAQELDGAQVFAPGSTQAPVEMGASPVATTAQPATAQYQAYNLGQQHPGPGWSQAPR